MLFVVRGAAQRAVWSGVLVVVGVNRLPSELLLEVIGGSLLDEGVFGVGDMAHDPLFFSVALMNIVTYIYSILLLSFSCYIRKCRAFRKLDSIEQNVRPLPMSGRLFQYHPGTA